MKLKISNEAVEDLRAAASDGNTREAVAVLQGLLTAIAFTKRIDHAASEEKAVGKILKLLGDGGYEPTVRACLVELHHYRPEYRAELLRKTIAAANRRPTGGKEQRIADVSRQLHRPEADPPFVEALLRRLRAALDARAINRRPAGE